MTNKELFKKIRDLECTLDEIVDFTDDRGRNTPDYFKEYYDFETIKKCLHLYYEGKISSKYLSEWAFAYSMILKGHQSFIQYRDFEEKLTFKRILERLFFNILGYLDEYDFETQWGENEADLHYYEKLMTALDEAYKNLEQWCAVYRFATYINENDEVEEMEEIVLLCVNHETKEFFIIRDGENYYEEDEIALIRLSKDAFENKVKELKDNGYNDLLPQRELNKIFNDFDDEE